MTQTIRHKIYTNAAACLQQVKEWKQAQERIVFTNGVFDLLHPGHVLYLEEAASLGTRLVLGLNSDASARSLGKGHHRPINHQQARALVVAALQSVDMVVIFDEATPLELITLVQPDVLVKGGDYAPDAIVGAKEVLAHGGTVKQIAFVDGYSTTAIEQKILEAGSSK